jgi:hypothetical protein
MVVCPFLKSEKMQKSLAYWDRVLEGSITPLNKVYGSNLNFSRSLIFFSSHKISKTLGWIFKGLKD